MSQNQQSSERVPVVPGVTRNASRDGIMSYTISLADRPISASITGAGPLLFPLGQAPDCTASYELPANSSAADDAWNDPLARAHPVRQRLLYEVRRALQNSVFFTADLNAAVIEGMGACLPGGVQDALDPKPHYGKIFDSEIYAARRFAEQEDERTRAVMAEQVMQGNGELQAGVNLGTLEVNGKTRRKCTVVSVTAQHGRVQLSVTFNIGRTQMTFTPSPLSVLRKRQSHLDSETLSRDIKANRARMEAS